MTYRSILAIMSPEAIASGTPMTCAIADAAPPGSATTAAGYEAPAEIAVDGDGARQRRSQEDPATGIRQSGKLGSSCMSMVGVVLAPG